MNRKMRTYKEDSTNEIFGSIGYYLKQLEKLIVIQVTFNPKTTA